MSVYWVLLWLLFGGVLEIIYRVQIGLKQDDVAFRDIVGRQDTQTSWQNGTNLSNRPEDCLQRDKSSNKEDPDDEIDEHGKRDPPGNIVLLTRSLYHESAQEADKGQEAVVAVHQSKGKPGLGVTHKQNFGGQWLVVRHHIVRAQVKIAETEQALGEEAQGDEEPGPSVGHPVQEGGGTAREFCHKGDLKGFDEEGRETTIEAQGIDYLLAHTKVVAGLSYIEAAAETQQRECEQGKEVQFASRSLHEGSLKVL